MFNNNTTLGELDRLMDLLIPSQSSLGMGKGSGIVTATLHKPDGSTLSGQGGTIPDSLNDLFRWVAPPEHQCPHCGEFDLHKLFRKGDSRLASDGGPWPTSWKCTSCYKDFESRPEKRVLLAVEDVKTLEDAKLYLEQHPGALFASGWADLIYECDDCGEEFVLELFQEEVERSQSGY